MADLKAFAEQLVNLTVKEAVSYTHLERRNWRFGSIGSKG